MTSRQRPPVKVRSIFGVLLPAYFNINSYANQSLHGKLPSLFRHTHLGLEMDISVVKWNQLFFVLFGHKDL